MIEFISTEHSVKLFQRLKKAFKNRSDERYKELVSLQDIFGDTKTLAKYYIEPDCQQVNPADEDEDEAISSLRSPAFQVVNKFLNREIVVKDSGASQMFILADAGMGKTSLLVMLKLAHIFSFWPVNYSCVLIKIGEQTIEEIRNIKNRANTVLLLDSLDEDPICKKGNSLDRLLSILSETTNFKRTIITCRTQFFPIESERTLGEVGKIVFNGFHCPLIYLSLFDEGKLKAYLIKRNSVYIFNRFRFFTNKINFTRSLEIIQKAHSLQFRPFLLSNIDSVTDPSLIKSEFEIYHQLVMVWIYRETNKISKNIGKSVNKESLLKACILLAEKSLVSGKSNFGIGVIKSLCHTDFSKHFMSINMRDMISGLESIDIANNSLLNRNSFGEFRFSHYSIAEFLIALGVKMGMIKIDDILAYVTDVTINFLSLSYDFKVIANINEKFILEKPSIENSIAVFYGKKMHVRSEYVDDCDLRKYFHVALVYDFHRSICILGGISSHGRKIWHCFQVMPFFIERRSIKNVECIYLAFCLKQAGRGGNKEIYSLYLDCGEPITIAMKKESATKTLFGIVEPEILASTYDQLKELKLDKLVEATNISVFDDPLIKHVPRSVAHNPKSYNAAPFMNSIDGCKELVALVCTRQYLKCLPVFNKVDENVMTRNDLLQKKI